VAIITGFIRSAPAYSVLGQLTERFQIKKVWARDLYYLDNRLLHKILSHTLAVFYQSQASSLLKVAGLVD